MTGYFDSTHDQLRASARKFVEREVIPNVERWEKEQIPRELWAKAGAAGFLGIGLPEECGGTAGDLFHVIAYSEELARAGSMGICAGLGSLGIAIPPILALGSEEQKRRFVPPVLAGEKIAALGVTEPDAGSDVANIRTRAVRDGDAYIINGAKTFITSGVLADFVTLAARTGGQGHEGVSLLVVEKGTPGFSVSRQIDKMGWHASDTAELRFEDCRVPAANLLGGEGAGFVGLMHNFQRERLFLAVIGVAFAKLAYDRSKAYADERQAFGRPIAGFQVTRHKLVDMAMRIDVAREYVYRLAARMNAGENCVREVAFAKIFCAEMAEAVCREAIQLHGGYGYATEFGIERLYRDVRLIAIGGGTSEIMKELAWKLL
ncbi:acyl-CoA dehydrogenase family protein [bacterium]|nr:acyl-CoA dehydrogenase family protein [bacterium]